MKKLTPETAEKRAIKDYLAIKGYYFYSNLQGLGCHAGIGDIVAIKNGAVWQIEVKAGKNKQSEAQKIFQEAWQLAGGNYICGNLEEIMKFIK